MKVLNIAGTDYLPNHKALCIYVSGCNPPHCKGCHNEELWDFDQGTPWEAYHFHVPSVVEKIWVMGGEPLHQDREELIKFLNYLNVYRRELWLWTGNAGVDEELCELVDYIKVGRYLHNVSGHTMMGVELASSNQRIYKV